MNRTRFLLALLLLSALVACQNQDPTPTVTEVAQVEDNPTATTAPSPTNTTEPTLTAAPEPTASPAPTATPEPAYEPLFESSSCEFMIPPGQDVECGWLTVPEDRSQLDKTIRLHVAIFHSDNPSPDPIIYLEGGPGGDSLETIPLVFAMRFAPFLENHDLIMFDQRGTGYSEPSLACPEVTETSFDIIEQDITPEQATEQLIDALFACQDRLVNEGVNLAAYNSRENAADLNDLRLALGYDEWNVWGTSYGTRLAQTVMRDHPEGIRTVVLDSTYPLDVNLLTDSPANAKRAFDVFFAGCATDTACNETYPDLENIFFEQVARFDEEPIILPLTNLLTGDSYDAYFRGTDLLGVLFQSLYSAELIPVLPEIIYNIAAADYTLLSALLSSFLTTSDSVSIGMQYSVQCYEENSFATEAEVIAAANEYPELQPFFINSTNLGPEALAICERWGVGQADAIENQNINSDIPTLILAGEYDPITPPEWGQEVANGLENSYFYEFPGIGHGASLGGECPIAIMESFWADPTHEPRSGCINQMTGPQFVPDTAAAEINLVPFTNDDFGLQGVIPEGWQEAGPGVYARGNNALDPTALIIQAVPGSNADLLLQLLSGQLGLEEMPESSQTLEVGLYTWELYQAETQGYSVDIALTESDGATIIVVMLSDNQERENLAEAVFMPVLEALELQ